MKKTLLGIKIFGWIEVLTFLIGIVTLLRIDYYPMIMLFFSPLVAILGIFTIKLNPLARKLNLSLSPLIVFTYSFGFMMVFEATLFTIQSNIRLNQWHFCILFMVALIAQILFFTRPKVKELFRKNGKASN